MATRLSPQASPQAFPTTITSLTFARSISLESTAALALELLHTPQTSAPSPLCLPGTLVPVQGMYGCSKDPLILIPFRLHRSAVSLSALNVSPLTQTIAPVWGSDPASVPRPTKGRSSPTNTPVFPPSFFVLLSFVWFCIFFSSGQVLLSTLSWCSAYTSVSEGIFLMYPWREMYSTSTYSSAILFSQDFLIEGFKPTQK